MEGECRRVRRRLEVKESELVNEGLNPTLTAARMTPVSAVRLGLEAARASPLFSTAANRAERSSL